MKTEAEKRREFWRGEICRILSNMLENPDQYGIFPTTIAYAELVNLCEAASEGYLAGYTEAQRWIPVSEKPQQYKCKLCGKFCFSWQIKKKKGE